MSNGSTAAEKAKWQKMRATPRKMTPDELHQRAVQRRDIKRQFEKMSLDARKAAGEGDRSRRATARAELRRLADLGHERNRVLGINPVYRGSFRGSLSHKAWLKEAKAFDAAQARLLAAA